MNVRPYRPYDAPMSVVWRGDAYRNYIDTYYRDEDDNVVGDAPAFDYPVPAAPLTLLEAVNTLRDEFTARRESTVDYTVGVRHKGTLYRASSTSSVDRDWAAGQVSYLSSAYPQRGVTYEVIVRDIMTPFAPRQLRPWA